MNNPQDFKKTSSGVVVNTNIADYRRARKRNVVRRAQDETFGENGTLATLTAENASMKDEIAALKAMVETLAKKG